MRSALRDLIDSTADLPPGQREVCDADGQRYRVTREGATSFRLQPLQSKTAVVVWTRADRRPSIYPPDLPFVAGVDAVVVIGGNGRTCTWTVTPPDRQQTDAGFAVIGRQAQTVEEELERADTAERLHRVWNHVVDECVSAQWAVTGETSTDFPFALRSKILEQGDRRRKIDRGAILGLPMVTLNETTVE